MLASPKHSIHTKKIIKSKYKNIDDIIESILKSCFIPFFIDGKMTYKNKYVDGFTPYIFKKCQNKKLFDYYLHILKVHQIY